MAKYNLNEVLKQRDTERSAADFAKAQAKAGWNKTNSFASNAEDPLHTGATPQQQLALDDVSRVKVLSPGRQVFKRFVRNRLAVTGSMILIIMFVFSFIGPLFYPYGQKQIFYKFDTMNENYALAKQNTAFNGYDIDPDVTVERKVVNSMNSNIKKMITSPDNASQHALLVLGEDGSYLIENTADNIYLLSSVDTEKVASLGSSTVKVGTYSQLGKSFEFEKDEIAGLAADAAANIKSNSGSFTSNGVEYTWQKGSKPKTFDVFAETDGLVFTGDDLGSEFEDALNDAVEHDTKLFRSGQTPYFLDQQGKRTDVYELGNRAEAAKVYTSYTLDTFNVGEKVSDEFKIQALLSIGNGNRFESQGVSYTIKEEDGVLVIYDGSGKEYAEFNLFSVRRYSGEDSMEYGLKKAISAKIEDMLEADQKTGSLIYAIPQQAEDGSAMKDEDGNYIMNDTEMKITQRLEGEYVINCEQIKYMIDTYASPSRAHVLGTDGDGFDMLARVMYGGRVSLMVGFVVVIIETILGVIMGGIAGYFGGWVDNLIMRLVDIFYCLPSLPIMIILGAMMDAMRLDPYKRLMVMMAVLGILGWAGVARLVRGQILSLREQEFMVATEATGIRIRDRIFKHLMPNVMPQLIVTATMGLGSVILTESTLSFLGLGVKHPLATWGTIINSVSSASAIAHYAFIWIPVGLLICLTVIAFNFVGDGLRDAYDPKSKR